MGRNPVNCRQAASVQSYAALALLTSCVAASALFSGCSKLGSQGALGRQSLPFVNDSATQQESGYSTTAKKSRDVSTQRVPNNPVREQIETVKPRPPKLSTMPKMTLYAEPVVNEASQVSWEQDVTATAENTITEVAQATAPAFDPTAEPPSQIFEQPVASDNVRVASRRTLEPMLFQRDSRKINRDFNGTLRSAEPSDATTNAVVPAPEKVANQVAEKVSEQVAEQPSDLIKVEPLLVVGDVKSEVEEVTKSAEKLVSSVNAKATTLSAIEVSTLPFQQEMVLEKTEQPIEQPQVAQTATTSPEEPANDPSDVSGQTENRWQTFESSEIAKTQLAQLQSRENDLPIVDENLINRASDKVREKFGVVESDLTKPLAAQSDTIKVDATLAPESRVMAIADSTPTKEALPKVDVPVIEPSAGTAIALPALDFTPSIEPLVMRPPIVDFDLGPAKPLPVLDIPSPQKIASDVNGIDHALAESDFQPAKQLNKHAVSDESQFSASVPNFETQDVPPFHAIVEQFEAGAATLKKGISQYHFAPVDLPTPSNESTARQVASSFDASENHFRTVSFDSNDADSKGAAAIEIPPVGVEALMKLNAVTWKSRLAETVDLVNAQLDSENMDSETRTSLEVNLRLLDVLSRQMNEIVENQQQFSESENQYWQDQLEAITSMLKIADPGNDRANEMLKHHSAHETLNHLRKAVAHLESLANLKVVSGVFCTEVSGYGQFQPFERYEFPSGQPVLVYCEIENFTSVEVESNHEDSGQSLDQNSDHGSRGDRSSFHTRLRGSYAVYDSSGHAVQQAEFPVLEDVARKRRRDFYMHLPITIGELADGDYELHLLIEDLGGNKTASLTPPLKFSVVAPREDRQARR